MFVVGPVFIRWRLRALGEVESSLLPEKGDERNRDVNEGFADLAVRLKDTFSLA